MFSKRTEWNFTLNPLSKLISEKRNNGNIITDLTISNPTLCGFNYPTNEILSALTDKSSMIYKPEPRGCLTAREAIVNYYDNLGLKISSENIVLASSSSEAYSFLFKLLCDTTNEVIVPTPSYPLFDYLCQINDVKLKSYQLKYDGEWHIDFKTLEKAFSKKTKAILLVHPNNPTGSFIKQDEYHEICSIAKEYNCSIIVDEVFSQYVFSNDERRAKIFNFQSTIPVYSLNGISKLLGLPQFKLSWIIIHAENKTRNEILNRLDIISDTYLSVNTLIQIALPKILSSSSFIRRQILNRVLTNYRFLQSISSNSSVSLYNAEGGWYAILQLPQKLSDEDWAMEILSCLDILTHPGYFFNINQKSCLVVSLLLECEEFKDATQRLINFIDLK